MTGYDRFAHGRAGGHLIMFLEALGSAILGLILAWAALHRLPHRLPSRTMVLSTGVAGALFGAFVTHSALGAVHLLAILVGALIVSGASLSLLLRPAGRLQRRSATA
jgi:hypothetical protein